ncbi:hypothetical protein RND81_07G167000 [Saponaria officinalis]|uniref:Uncharacterized protein n=1 Tax=Saponaria officinalis TaxID=3572 RepID=A0AAW1JUV4_SAPOF
MRMVKGNYVEVAPSAFVAPQRKSSVAKLETIFEECPQQCDVIVPKRIFIALPVFLAMILYFLLYKNIA